MLITDRPSADVEALRARLHGEVFGPDDAGYDEHRKPWNRAVDQRPAAVAFPRTDEDVVTLVDLARNRGLELAPQATGHGAGATGTLERTILVSTKHMRGVRIDPTTRIARVRAGNVWSDVTGPAALYGLAPLAGSAPDVGIVGYTLGGGLGWLARAHGWACNSVTAIELVTADGRLVRTDTRTEPELFWALRGGGSTLRHRHRDRVRALPGRPSSTAARSCSPAPAPRRCSPPGVIGRAPCRTRSRRCAGSSARPGATRSCWWRSRSSATTAPLAPLRALQPVADLVAPMPPDRLTEIHNDPKEPSAGASGHRLLNDVPDGALAQLIAHAGGPLVSVELRHLGGELSRGSVCNGALNDVKAEFALFAVGLTPDARGGDDRRRRPHPPDRRARAVGRGPRARELHREGGPLPRRLHPAPPACAQGAARRRRDVRRALDYGFVVESVNVSVFE